MISTEPGDVTVLKGETRSGFLSSMSVWRNRQTQGT